MLLKRKPTIFKKADKAKLQFAFKDSNGKKYYRYVNDMDIPKLRFDHLSRFIIEYGRGLDKNEMKFFLDNMEQSLQRKDKDGKLDPDLATIGFLVKEMRFREKALIHEESLFNLVSALYIHEDQNPAEWDDELEAEKVKQFKIDAAGRLYDFFYKVGVSKYLPFFVKCKGDYVALAKDSAMKMEALKEVLKPDGLGQKLTSSLTNLNKKDGCLQKECQANT